MITLLTPPVEQRFASNGFEPALRDLQKQMRRTSAAIAASSPLRILHFSTIDEISSPESVRPSEDNPMIVRVAARNQPAGKLPSSVFAVIDACGAFCDTRGLNKHLVVVEDTDFYCYPDRELGQFTRQLDFSRELIETICGLGELLAGYQGDLVLIAALDQNPARIRDFLDEYGWSWLTQEGDRFRTRHGSPPACLVPHCIAAAAEAAAATEWSEPRTIQEWARRFGVSRNTMSKRLRQQAVRNERFGALYRIAVADLPR